MTKIVRLMLIIFAVFLIWMIFFDENSYINKRKLNKEIKKLEKENTYYQNEIEKDNKTIKNLSNPDSLEKYAREKYKMKKKNEEIFLIEFDTVN